MVRLVGWEGGGGAVGKQAAAPHCEHIRQRRDERREQLAPTHRFGFPSGHQQVHSRFTIRSERPDMTAAEKTVSPTAGQSEPAAAAAVAKKVIGESLAPVPLLLCSPV